MIGGVETPPSSQAPQSPPVGFGAKKSNQMMRGVARARSKLRFSLPPRSIWGKKKGNRVITFFAPNLTMNLTYLCYGIKQI